VRIAGRVRTAELHSRGPLLARVVQGDAHQRRTVTSRPGRVHGRLVARHEALVRVHPLREYRTDFARMPQLAGDERLAHIGEEVLVVAVEESILAVPKQ